MFSGSFQSYFAYLHSNLAFVSNAFYFSNDGKMFSKMESDTARSREDETRNGHRNAKRNPRHHSSLFKWLISEET